MVTELKRLLRDRAYSPGAQFLTEREIAERFATSRATANKALTSLASEDSLSSATAREPSCAKGCWITICNGW